MKTSAISSGKPGTKAKTRSTRANGDAARTNGNSSTWSQPSHEQIASLASQLYRESGCQEGQDAENWLRAEQILVQQAAGQATSARSQAGRKSES